MSNTNYIPWKTLGDFARDHDMVIAKWLFQSNLLYNMESHNEYDEDEGYPKDIFQLFIVERSTIDDIEMYNLDFPYYLDDDLGLYVMGITVYGMSWDLVDLDYYINNDKNDESDEDDEH